MTNPLQGPDKETQERMTGTTWLEKVGVVESLRGLSRCSARQNPMLSTEELAAFGKLADDHEALLAKLDSLESALREATGKNTTLDGTSLCPHCESDQMQGKRACLDCGMIETWHPSAAHIRSQPADTGEST